MQSENKTPRSPSLQNVLCLMCGKPRLVYHVPHQLDLEECIADLSQATSDVVEQLRHHLGKYCVCPSPKTSPSVFDVKKGAKSSSRPVEVGRRKFRAFEKDQSSRT